MKRIMLKFSVTSSSLLAHTAAVPLFATSMDSTVSTYHSSYGTIATMKVQASDNSTRDDKVFAFH